MIPGSAYDSWFRDEVAKGQAQAARGELIDHEEVVQRIESHLQTSSLVLNEDLIVVFLGSQLRQQILRMDRLRQDVKLMSLCAGFFQQVGGCCLS